MAKYNSHRQLTIEEFKTPFLTSLLADNKLIKLSKIVPWDRFASVYKSMMTVDFGRASYMPFFIGLEEFTTQPVKLWKSK